MANTYTTLTSLFKAIADAIRSKTGNTHAIVADTFPAEIENLKTGFDYNNQNATAISDYEFYNCTDLKNVNCYSLISIGTSAFENCSNLKTIILWDNVINIGENAFKGCSNATIYCYFESQPDTWHESWNPDNYEVAWVGGAVETWDISATEDDNVTAKLYNDVNSEGMYSLVISGSGNMKEYQVGYKAPWRYSYYTNITSATIKNGIVYIDKAAFANCSNLTSVGIPNSVTEIGAAAFLNCGNLTSITIPEEITNIGYQTFSDCSSLTSIAIPNSVVSIGDRAFAMCENLTSVYISDLTAWCSINFYNEYANPLYYAHKLYLDGELIKDLVIPDGVTSINNYSFQNCSSLTSITIPNSVTSIGNWAFYNCSGLTSITISNSVTSIGTYAFYNCTSLTSIIIPNSVTSIDTGAFYGCTNLTSITIPDSVTSISDNTFSDCSSLTSINYTGTTVQWKAITLGSNWNYNTPNYTIHCTDGDIAKDGTITYHTTT